MLKRFVCLANSYKEGGRCLAGIELNAGNQPMVRFGFLQWIRPVCNTTHGEIPPHLVAHITILDIVETEITGYPQATGYQCENVFFNEKTMKVVGRFNPDIIDYLCDERSLIFENRGKAVSQEAIKKLSYSLMFIKAGTFEVVEKFMMTCLTNQK